MKYYSTNSKSNSFVSFEEAVFRGLAPDGGLYMPEMIPTLDAMFFRQLPSLSMAEIGLEVVSPWIGNEIPKKDLKGLVEDAFDFSIPLKLLDEGMGVLELFHGPSFAFKDVGARFMSRIMGYFVRNNSRLLDVLVATSGDTGGAVALGFLDVPGIRVTILYPEGKVSPVQEWQLTSHGKNIRAIAVEGSFDDCQALVKQAFQDVELQQKLRMTSANSINISRLLPQSLYYFSAFGQLMAQGMREVVFAVPSGNFGNIGAGLLAEKMGLPVKKWVAATNANDTVPRYLSSGSWDVLPTQATLSNAMDVSNPSNWARIVDMFEGDLNKIRNRITSFSFNDEQTLKAMDSLHKNYGYFACPHTAIAWLAIEKYRKEHVGEYASVFLSTAHPCKFPDVFEDEIPEPIAIQGWQNQPKFKELLKNNFFDFKNYLMRDIQ